MSKITFGNGIDIIGNTCLISIDRDFQKKLILDFVKDMVSDPKSGNHDKFIDEWLEKRLNNE